MTFLFLILSLFAHQHTALDEVASYTYSRPDTALALLRQIDYDRLSEAEQAYYHIEAELATVLSTATLYPADGAAAKTADRIHVLSEHERYLPLSHAYLLHALYLLAEHNPYEAMRSLKEAEHLCLSHSSMPEGLDILYYQMGQCSEQEMLLDVAAQYYRKAASYVPYPSISSAQMQRKACLYREAYRTTHDTTYLRLAEQAAIRLQDSLLLAELHDDQHYLFRHGSTTAGLALARLHLENHRFDSCQWYLAQVANDTASLPWFAQQYHYLHSQWMLRHHPEEAFGELLHLFDTYRRDIEADAQTRTYTIARLYDLEQEQTANFRLAQQRQRWIIFSLVLLVFIGIIVFLFFYLRQRAQLRHARQIAEQERALAEQQRAIAQQERTMAEQQRDIDEKKRAIDTLQTLNRVKKDLLRQNLHDRVMLTKRLHVADYMQAGETEQAPEWAQAFINEALVSTDSQADDIRQQFEAVYDGLLGQLQNEYPELTAADLTVICLSILGLNGQDICLLLNVPKRTFYTRRQRMCKHLHLESTDDLDTFLSRLSV